MKEPLSKDQPTTMDPAAARLAGMLFLLAAAIVAVVGVLRAISGESITSAVALGTLFGGVGLVFVSIAKRPKGES